MDKFEKRKKDFLEVSEKLSELFDKKNRDYNDSYFNVKEEGFGIDKKLSSIDFYLQLRRKFSRLASFAEKRLINESINNQVADETEEDTIRDVAIYCIMELIKRDQK